MCEQGREIFLHGGEKCSWPILPSRSERNDQNEKPPFHSAVFRTHASVDYLTASFRVFGARNFGTRIAFIWIVAPVRGFLPVRPARVFASKMPRPAIEISSPPLSVSVIIPMIASTARSPSALVQPIVEATFSTKSILFAIGMSLTNNALHLLSTPAQRSA